MSEAKYRKLRIFIASPSDMVTERARMHTLIDELNRSGQLADHLGLTLEALDWRTQVAPLMGRPETVVLDQLPVESWDVFVGILWLRFGTAPGATDPQTGQAFGSGTQEEFALAYDAWRQRGRPQLLMYRCTRVPASLDMIDPDQHKLVRAFFAQFDADAAHPGMYQSFEAPDDFERRVRQDLTKLLLAYSKQLTGETVAPDVVATLAPQAPDTLPRRAPFFGRTDEISQALRALGKDDRGWGLVLDGIGGIGKTALAVEVAHICKERGLFEAFVFVSANRDRLEPAGIQEIVLATATLDGLVDQAARALGQPGIAKLVSAEKRRALLDELRSRRALLVFDNLETLTPGEQSAIGDFLRFLPQDSKAIITSRRRSGEAAFTLRLERLKWEEARELIADQIVRHPDVRRALARAGEAGWKQLYDEAGGSPLALLWMIGLINARGLSFERALALLRDGSGESDLNQFIYGEARKTMDANERAVLGALALFGGPATFEALAAAANLERRALDTVLERLRALSLVDLVEGSDGQEPLEERYTLHPLTRRFARADLAADAAAEHATGMRFAEYWVEYAEQYGGSDKESYKTYHRLEAEWLNLDAVANWLWETAAVQGGVVGDADAARMLSDLARALQNFVWFIGRWDEAIQLAASAYTVANALHDWRVAGRHAYDVAWIYYERGRIDDLAMWTNRCAEAWAREGGKDEQAIALQLKSSIAQEREDYEEAERLMQEALAIWHDLDATESVAIGLNSLGGLARERKDYDAAEDYYRQALELAQKIDNKKGQAIYINNLGKIALDRERWAEARDWFEQALPLAQEIGQQNLIAAVQAGLARVWEGEGRADMALPLAHAALAIYERLQHRKLTETRALVARLRAAVGE